ncbi:MAG: 50S ribosomal protein L3 [Planctomycetes bacterium RBG_16_59_8]|nr:MAG: 50S ribosomal protein L3 [Planctomycetes bacterium RBG_16_59_8]
MLNGLIGKKIGMTQIFSEDGRMHPVTVLEAGPCVVLRVKSKDSDGYDAVQLGFSEKKKNVGKPAAGFFKALNVKPVRTIREYRIAKAVELKTGETVGAALFDGVKKIDVQGVSKGRGFAGAVKRWGKHRGPESHGSMSVRAPGSAGANTDPARVIKGKHYPGHMGAENVTVRNLRIVKVDAAKNLLYVRGAVPGANGGVVEIRKSPRQ